MELEDKKMAVKYLRSYADFFRNTIDFAVDRQKLFKEIDKIGQVADALEQELGLTEPNCEVTIVSEVVDSYDNDSRRMKEDQLEEMISDLSGNERD